MDISSAYALSIAIARHGEPLPSRLSHSANGDRNRFIALYVALTVRSADDGELLIARLRGSDVGAARNPEDGAFQ
ncbi:hypothetical protein PQR75_04880 [Paraburkholderia fungorum]|uniref:hypothetical protein n=1 Tax=Paraburkholderia fungorum TaxID=134537 RepID=UPI0038B9E9AF